MPPGNVHAEATNSTAIRFTWNAPSPQFINGINQGYKVGEVSSLPGRETGEMAPGVGGGDRGLQERAVKSPWASETRLQQAEVTAKSRDAFPLAPGHSRLHREF